MRTLLLLGLIGLASGCSLVGPSRAEAALADARRWWAARGPESYTMTQTRGCFCPPEFVGPFEVTVRRGAVVSVRYNGAQVPSDRARTVEALFDLIADAYARDADDVQVAYHPTLGYPTQISIDYRAEVADDELSITVADLTAAE